VHCTHEKCCCGCDQPLERRTLSVQIANAGGWEEFHQRRREPQADWWKARRLKMEAEYRAKWG